MEDLMSLRDTAILLRDSENDDLKSLGEAFLKITEALVTAQKAGQDAYLNFKRDDLETRVNTLAEKTGVDSDILRTIVYTGTMCGVCDVINAHLVFCKSCEIHQSITVLIGHLFKKNVPLKLSDI